jgi:protein-L-isoaspartate O-methyltransferase
LKRQGYTNVEVRIGNGYTGWPNHAPFDKVSRPSAGSISLFQMPAWLRLE